LPSLPTKSLRIEIKPVVSDDYPSVLRQMKQSKANILYLTQYIGEGISEDEFIRTFLSQGIYVVFERDIEEYKTPKLDFIFEELGGLQQSVDTVIVNIAGIKCPSCQSFVESDIHIDVDLGGKFECSVCDARFDISKEVKLSLLVD